MSAEIAEIVYISADLALEASRCADKNGTSLRAFVEQAVRNALEDDALPPGHAHMRFKGPIPQAKPRFFHDPFEDEYDDADGGGGDA